MSKQMKLRRCLLLIDLNQSITAYWLLLCFVVIVLLMRSRIFLLTFPISDFVGLMSLQVGLFAKFGLWFFSVMNASLLAVASTLSSIPSFDAMSLFPLWIACVVSGSAFLYDFVIFFIASRCR